MKFACKGRVFFQAQHCNSTLFLSLRKKRFFKEKKYGLQISRKFTNILLYHLLPIVKSIPGTTIYNSIQILHSANS